MCKLIKIIAENLEARVVIVEKFKEESKGGKNEDSSKNSHEYIFVYFS